jgi:hypothetical protein
VTNSIIKQTARLGEQVSTQSPTLHHATHQIADSASRLIQGVSSTPHTSEAFLSAIFRHIHDVPSPDHFRGIIVLLRMISEKASVVGFERGFVMAGIIVLLSLPLGLMLKPGWYQPSGSQG